MADTTHNLQITFTTDQTDKTLTKTFSSYNTALEDSAIRTAAKTIASTQVFASDAGVIASVKKMERIDRTITSQPISPRSALES